MQRKKFNMTCVRGHQAVRVCSFPTCKKSPIRCQNVYCQCNSKHQKCMMQSTLISLQKGFFSKGMNYIFVLKQLYQFYEIQFKEIEQQMKTIQKQIEKSQLFLQGQQLKLFKDLKQGNYKDITSQSINKFINSIINQNQDQLKILLNTKKKEISGILDEVKALNCYKDKCINFISFNNNNNKPQIQKNDSNSNKYNNSYINSQQSVSNRMNNTTTSNNNFNKIIQSIKFNPNLHHRQIELINENIIKCTKNGKSRGAFISPQFNTDKKCKLKINKSQNGDIFFGICQMINIKYSDIDIYDSMRYGVMLYCSSPQHIFPGKTRQSKIVQGDIIQLSYISSSQTITFRNSRTNECTKISFKVQNSQPLYFCVLLYNLDDEIQIVN